MPSHNQISIKGARVHNLKNISIDLPKGKFIVITGLSGSGKSSLAFDTIHAEGQRRYMESLSSYARQFLELQDKPDIAREIVRAMSAKDRAVLSFHLSELSRLVEEEETFRTTADMRSARESLD